MKHTPNHAAHDSEIDQDKDGENPATRHGRAQNPMML
jgi:hypothetical protein